MSFDKDMFKKNVQDETLNNDNVQFHCALLSQGFDDSHYVQGLSKDIIEL